MGAPTADTDVKATTHANHGSAVETRPGTDDFDIGQEVAGTVIELNEHGAVVDIGRDVHAYVHIGNFRTERVEKISDIAAVGDKITARVTAVRWDQVQIAVKDMPEFHKRPLSEFKKGDEVEGTVVLVTKSKKGSSVVYFDIGAMVRGFARGKGETFLKKGDTTKVKVKYATRNSIELSPA